MVILHQIVVHPIDLCRENKGLLRMVSSMIHNTLSMARSCGADSDKKNKIYIGETKG